MSGTPVICSDRAPVRDHCRRRRVRLPHAGKLSEAINRNRFHSPAACRDRALRDYHYLRMAKDYLKEYEKGGEIAGYD